MKNYRWTKFGDARDSEEGSAVALTLVVLAMVSIPLTMMLGWSEEFNEMNRNYRLPKLEIQQNISTLVSCSDTLSAIPVSNTCKTETVVNGISSSKAIVVNDRGLDILSTEGKKLAVARIVCKNGRRLHVQMLRPENKNGKFFDIGRLKCKS